MQIIDGKAIATQIKEQIKAEVATMARKPSLVAVLVGNDGASETYVKNKEQACAYIGFKSEVRKFSAEITQTELIAEIERLNADTTVDGFIVQMPLPAQIDEAVIINSIDPRKDVDGFHPVNVGRMILGLPSYVAATPLGILELLRHTNIETSGKKCVVIGRSNIVGRPISNLLSAKGWDCTVTLCHSRTTGLKEICLEADIIIAALGVPHFVKADIVKTGAVVIDVGISRIPCETTKSGWKMAGDVEFDNVAPKCSYITPVPGGVGPMTIISLMKNTLLAAKGEIYK